MMKKTYVAKWKGVEIARSDRTKVIEGNHYFPPDDVQLKYLKPNKLTTMCHWKGTASYCDVEINGEVNQSAAFYYPSPLLAAQDIAGYIAFWKGVSVKKA